MKKLTIDDGTKIHNSVGVIFGLRVCTNTVGMNAYFGAIRTNSPPTTPNYGIVNTNYNMDY